MKIDAEGRGDEHAGPGERQQDAHENEGAGEAVDQGRLVDLARDLVEEADHDPHHERQREAT